MSKLLLNLALAPAKTLMTAYTWSTLPFYAAVQKPWKRLKLSRSFDQFKTIDKYGRVVYSRLCRDRHFQHPYFKCNTFNEIVPLLNRERTVVGTRDVLSEEAQLDESLNPIKIDGRELKKLTLAKAYRWYTVGEVMDRVDSLARGLEELGVKSGDKVVLYAENSLEWLCVSLALQRINAVAITLLTILNIEGLTYGINQCEARFLITSQDLLTKKISQISHSIQNPLSIVFIEDKLAPKYDPSLRNCVEKLKSSDKFSCITSYESVMESGSKIASYDFPIPHPDDLTLIMYTSGTTGTPKGVMFTHRQIATGQHNLIRYDRELENPLMQSRFAAYLPMAHIFGYMLNLGLFINSGQIALCSPLTMLDSSPAHVPGQVGDIKLIEPNYMAAVPLVLDRMLKEIYRKLNARGPLAAPMFTYLMDYKIRWRSRGFDTPIINRMLCAPIKAQFGGKLNTITVGGAPLNERTHALAQAALNIRCTQGYGTTEMSAGSHIMHNDDLSYGACGVPFHSAKFYLKDWVEGGYFASDQPNPRGEIVAGGDNISSGYYKMDEETEEAFKVDPDGTKWFESGDIGEVLPDGRLRIIDRKKDLTKLANGEFVSLGKLESGYRASPYIENICICTDPYKNYVTALIVPNRRSLTELAGKLSLKSTLTFDQLCTDEQVIQHVHDSLRELAKQLEFNSKEIPIQILLVSEEWSQDNDLLTAAMKLKRKQVNVFYRKQIDQMFRSP